MGCVVFAVPSPLSVSLSLSPALFLLCVCTHWPLWSSTKKPHTSRPPLSSSTVPTTSPVQEGTGAECRSSVSHTQAILLLPLPALRAGAWNIFPEALGRQRLMLFQFRELTRWRTGPLLRRRKLLTSVVPKQRQKPTEHENGGREASRCPGPQASPDNGHWLVRLPSLGRI